MKKTSAVLISALVAFIAIPTAAKANSGDFDGAVVIGTSYAATYTAPTNGLLVQGNVGIGTTSPVTTLHVLGTTGTPNLYSDTGIFTLDSGANFQQLEFGALLAAPYTVWMQTKQSVNLGGSLLLALNPLGGNVGIGTTTPSYTLHVNGSVAGTSAYVNLSDARYKKHIKPLDSGLKEIQELKPVAFEWASPKDHSMEGPQFGFVAQDVEKVLPSVVVTEGNNEKTKGMKYTDIIPVLTKAVQELHYLIEDQNSLFEKQKETLTKQQAEIDELKQTIARLTQQK